jgi:phage gp36-like protein
LAWVGAAIARRHLFTVSPSDAVEEGYKSAIAWLAKWASGVVTLRTEMAEPAQPTPEQIAAWLAAGWDEYGAVWSRSDARVLTSATLKDF